MSLSNGVPLIARIGNIPHEPLLSLVDLLTYGYNIASIWGFRVYHIYGGLNKHMSHHNNIPPRLQQWICTTVGALAWTGKVYNFVILHICRIF